MNFTELKLIEPVLRALAQEGYERPTPIQEKAIPAILEHRDLLGCAQTGTGKTAAFTVPILQIMHQDPEILKSARPIRTLILTPTRELAIQIGESIRAYGRHLSPKSLVIFGGVSQVPQVDGLKRGVDILVATPGRLLDLMNQGYISLAGIRWFVLDEADRMLDMGFIHDVKKIIAHLPSKRQTLFFSATMPPEIQSLSSSLLQNPIRVEVTPVSSTAETVAQTVYHVDKKNKPRLLLHLLGDASIQSLLVFSRTKHGANRIAKDLVKAGVSAEAIHGNKSQNARQQALQSFKNRKTRVLVATDIAARGIDIDELSHVANFDLPNVPETYVHRIGRTGRAGASGKAFSFCDAEEREFLRDIQRLIGSKIPVVEEHPYPLGSAVPETTSSSDVNPTSAHRRHHAQQAPHGNRPQSRHPRSDNRPPSPRRTEERPAIMRQPARAGAPNPPSSRPQEPNHRNQRPPMARPERTNTAASSESRPQGRPADRTAPRKRPNPPAPSTPAAKPLPPKADPDSSIQFKPVFDDLDRW